MKIIGKTDDESIIIVITSDELEHINDLLADEAQFENARDAWAKSEACEILSRVDVPQYDFARLFYRGKIDGTLIGLGDVVNGRIKVYGIGRKRINKISAALESHGLKL